MLFRSEETTEQQTAERIRKLKESLSLGAETKLTTTLEERTATRAAAYRANGGGIQHGIEEYGMTPEEQKIWDQSIKDEEELEKNQ